MRNRKIEVFFFQRRPRNGFSFSIEYIFQEVRQQLSSQIEAKVLISSCFNDGYLSKLINVLEAGFRQGSTINHITGEVHFLNFLMRRRHVILTIHDCGVIRRKTGFAKKIVNWLYLSGPVKRASVITAVSEETKKEIVSYTNCKPEKIKVIPVFVDPRYLPMPKKFNKLNPTILHIGTGPNKNLLRLIEALAGLECFLVIIGKLSDDYLNALAQYKIAYRNEYNISHDRLNQVYNECDILSFVSTFEGFGMPIIEANSVERVVVTSNISSMPEVAGDSGCLIDPFDIRSIRNGFIKVIENDQYREQLIELGRKNKLRFEVSKIANMYLDVYKQVSLH